MATLYFNNAVDSNWSELGNWWTNSGHTSAAAGLPTSSDSVVASGNINGNAGSMPTVVNFTTFASLAIQITVTGVATFSGSAANLTNQNSTGGEVIGNCVFQNGAKLWQYATVTGNATFHDTALAHMQSSITGNVTVTASTFDEYPLLMDPASIGGTITFSSATPVVFNLAYYAIGSANSMVIAVPAVGQFTGGAPTWNFGNSDIRQALPGNVVLSGNSFIGANVGGNLTVDGGVMGSAPSFGTVSGNATFTNNAVFNNGTVSGNATFNSSARVSGDLPYGSAFNYPTVNGTATFTGSGSYPIWGTFYGPLVMDVASAKTLLERNNEGNYTDGTVTITYEKGVNGSSILGVV